MMLGWASLVFALSSILLCSLGIIYADEAASHFHKELLLNHRYDVEDIQKCEFGLLIKESAFIMLVFISSY
jgi:hypothetical protein